MTAARLRVALVLVALAAVVVAERVHTYSEPLERDAAGYAVISHELGRGRLLYTDLWDRKPPLLYVTFGAAERAVGYGPGEIFALNVAAALATLAAVYAAGRAGGGGAVGGLVAAGLWAAVGGDLRAQANQPNAEVFVNATLAWAFAVLVGRRDRPGAGGARWVVGLGLLMAAATLYKQPAAVAVGALLAGDVLTAGDWRTAARRAGRAVATGAVVAVAWAAVLGYFAARGRLTDAVDSMLWQGLAYAGDAGGGVSAHLRAAVWPGNLFTPAMGWAAAPAALVAAAVVTDTVVTAAAGGRRRPAARWWVWGCYAAGAWVAVVVPGYFLAHYYQLLMPPLCVAGGWAGAALVRRGAAAGRVPRGLAGAGVGVALAVVAVRQGAEYRLSPEQWARRGFQDTPYFDNDFTRHRDVARRLAAMLRPGETFWNLGEDTTLYFVAGRSPPVGLMWLDPVVIGGDPARYWPRLMADLDRSRPDLVVVSMRTFRAVPPSAPVFPWLRAHYAVADTGDLGRPTYRLFVRRGTDLFRRLNGPATGPATRAAATGPAALTGTAP